MLNQIKFTKDSKKEPTYFLSGDEGIDDEYFINEIIGIDEFTYQDWIEKNEKNMEHRKR